ncbi:hypothetical protein [Cellvibrio mixtus]|uniref:hypothetical protein n=1 Tax=Cellvibrio mixtus TaxID=39650 RepID=UPI000587ABE1|nr:hypothetical protein [Cellvibrio mixtus]
MPYQSRDQKKNVLNENAATAASVRVNDQRVAAATQLALQRNMGNNPVAIQQQKTQQQMNVATANKFPVIQRDETDVSDYVFKNRNTIKTIEGLKEIFEGCYNNGKLMTKWGPRRKDTLEHYITTQIDRDLVKSWVKDTSVPSKIRKMLLELWNKGQSKKLKLNNNLIADLVQDVSTLDLDSKGGLKRSDSFTFEGGTKVPDFSELLGKLDQTTKVEDSSGKKLKKVPSTKSLRTSGLLIRAYGDDMNAKQRQPGTEFVLDLGGSLGIYRDAYGNGDMFYYPLENSESRPDVYQQEGNSSEHTWTGLAKELSSHSGLEDLGEKLAQVLQSEYKGKLNRSEVNAIGAMLADVKLSIQGWVYAVEQLKTFDLNEKTIEDLFAVIGGPFWKYSLNASHVSNSKIPDDEKGRKAGLGFKKTDIAKRKRNSAGTTGNKPKKKKLTETVNDEK